MTYSDRPVPWRHKFRVIRVKDEDGWFCTILAGVLAFTFQWRNRYLRMGPEVTGLTVSWIPLDVQNGGLMKVLLNLKRERERKQEWLQNP